MKTPTIVRLVIITAMAFALAGPADAAPTASSCSFGLSLPAVIGMSQATQTVPTQLSVDCPAAASYSVSIELTGDPFYGDPPLGPLHYDQTSRTAAFSFTSCRSGDFSNNGHYTASLVSADVKDAQGQAITQVRLLPASTVAVNSALAYAASSRRGSAVYINGLLKDYGFYTFGEPPAEGFGCGLSRSAGTMYLQRLLNGAWQTMLAGTAGHDGVTAVGFVQAKIYQYRWVVLSVPASPVGASPFPDGLLGSASASTVR